jgi:CheY-like chemotaxis protein
MGTHSTLLCIHRDPAQLSLLQENGYRLLTATNGHDGLRLFMSRPVDAIVLEYQLSFLDGAFIAAEIKQMRSKVPIVMLANNAELPDGVLNSVDALVPTSDPPHFVWAAVHFLLHAKLRQHEANPRAGTHARLRRVARSWEAAKALPVKPFRSAIDEF